MKEILTNTVKQALVSEGISAEQAPAFVIEHPADLSHGDYSTNVALASAKVLKKNPVVLANALVEHMRNNLPEEVASISVAGAGFINFTLEPGFFNKEVGEVISKGDAFGRISGKDAGKKIALEYTDPNPFKQFHIGHLMTNIIGESLARLAEWNSADVRRFCYQGDVGRHVALTIWGLRFMERPFPSDSDIISEKTKFLGEAYALGAKKIAEDPGKENEVQAINKKIYDRSDEEVNTIYDKGREWSLEHFEEIYKILGTKFDHYFFESQSAPVGMEIVKVHTPSVFKESDGAVIFAGEEHGLHTRVFITKENLPTYEAKDVGLAKIKHDLFAYDKGIVITANEQSDYFSVLLKALSLIPSMKEIAEKSSHISHGMLRFATGKMSSRTGNVITGESLLNDMIEASIEKVKDRPLEDSEKKKIAEQVAVGALKYWILKQSIGKDIIFDKEKALSFEGDSGPYLQYAHTRAQSVLRNASAQGMVIPETVSGFVNVEGQSPHEIALLRTVYRFPEVVEEAYALNAPQQVVTFLTELASTFNGYYATTTIIDPLDIPLSQVRLALVSAFAIVMKNGLTVLGIPVPERM